MLVSLEVAYQVGVELNRETMNIFYTRSKQITNFKLQIHSLIISNHKPQITNFKLQITKFKFQITNSITNYNHKLQCWSLLKLFSSGSETRPRDNMSSNYN